MVAFDQHRRRLAKLLPCLDCQGAASTLGTVERRLPPLGGELPPELAGRVLQRLRALQQRAAPCASHPCYADLAVYTKAVDLALKYGEFYGDDDDGGAATAALDVAEARLVELEQAGAQPKWCTVTGLVARGYVSSVDGSPQPYGLELPPEAAGPSPLPLFVWLHGRGDKTTDLHFLANCTRSSLFPTARFGTPTPPGMIILHAFGRGTLGFKWSGELDVLDAVEHACGAYNIDRDRIALGGFSMGGAGAWHIAAHYPDKWCVVHPGAGFVLSDKSREYTPEYVRQHPEQQLRMDAQIGGQADPSAPDAPAHEKTLWGLYDVPDYARSLLNVPLVVYSGENDAQMAPARWMEPVMAEEGLRFPHIIGQGQGHSYSEEGLAEVLRRVGRHIAAGRDTLPDSVSIQTKTLRYAAVDWLEIYRLEQHWVKATVDARLVDPPGGARAAAEGKPAGSTALMIETTGVRALRASPPQVDLRSVPIIIDGQTLCYPGSVAGDDSLGVVCTALLVKGGAFNGAVGRWAWVKEHDGAPLPATGSLAVHLLSNQREDQRQAGAEAPQQLQALEKVPGMQGPIDDVYMGPFLIVLPDTAAATRNATVARWAEEEAAHFCARYEGLCRGAPRVKRADEVTQADKRHFNLVLWGTPQTNSLTSALCATTSGGSGPGTTLSMREGFPIDWGEEEIVVGGLTVSAEHHAVVGCYPSPWVDCHCATGDVAPRYVCLNSGLTFREGHDYTNSVRILSIHDIATRMQNPKLPDWAVLRVDGDSDDGSVVALELAAGAVVACGMFDEFWRLC